MKTIAHLSDLHFGAEDRELAEHLAADVAEAKPTVIAISGDLTQRARSREFAAAKAWLDAIPGAKVIVPGNHDVPLWNVVRRALSPLSHFRRILQADTDPVWSDDGLLVLGVNTARAGTISGGRISGRQVARVCRQLETEGIGRLRVLVAHHPFAATERHSVVGGARVALTAFAEAGLDLVLGGHHHVPFAGQLGDWHVGLASTMLVSHAATALSPRVRGHANGWTRIAVQGHRLSFDVREWVDGRFRTAASASFRRTATGWLRA